MDLRKLRYFAGVVEAKSISRAAETLHVAQPALSKSIQALELDLGTPLLQRTEEREVRLEPGAMGKEQLERRVLRRRGARGRENRP